MAPRTKHPEESRTRPPLAVRFALLAGAGRLFHKQVARSVPVRPGMRLLDLCCGPGCLSLALAERIGPEARIDAVDVAWADLATAQARARSAGAGIAACQSSLDALAFPNGVFDAVTACLRLQRFGASEQRHALAEAARVLKPGGALTLVFWCRPRLTPAGIVMAPWLYATRYSVQGWENLFPGICRAEGLQLVSDRFLSSVMRCQVYRKATGPPPRPGETGEHSAGASNDGA